MIIEDTIAAISTPLGEGGIGIVRISGHQALAIAQKIFKTANGADLSKTESHKLIYGHIVNFDSDKIIDEVLLGVFRAPHSFTTEDTVEINCHSGIITLQEILYNVLQAGARLAEPGEFSKRAFLSGRIDLVQAESIIDIIRSKTEKSRQMAINQLTGALSQKIKEQRKVLLLIIAHIEALIDFPEDDIESLPIDNIKMQTNNIIRQLDEMLAESQRGIVYREGISVAIIGKPNVGKSSLLNMFLQKNRAIVSNIPGTTRDIIEEYIKINNIAIKFIDTAGIRVTDNEIEKIGVQKSYESLKEADLILLLLDAQSGLTEDDIQILEQLSEHKTIIVVNKVDLIKPDENFYIKLNDLKKKYNINSNEIEISAKQKTGLKQLSDTIETMILSGKIENDDSPLISNVRQKYGIQETREFLLSALNNIAVGVPIDIVSIDYNSAWNKLGEIIGETIGEEIIDQIFADFCVGK